MAWVYDAPTGVFRDHFLSSNIRMTAIERMIFAKWVRPERGYGKGKGQSVTITRIQQLERAGRITETEGIPVQTATVDTKSVTVVPWGMMLELTEFQEHLTHFNIRNTYQRLLRNNMQLTVDGMICEALRATPVKAIPVAAGTTFDTDGTPSTQADRNWSVEVVRSCRDNLVRRKVPPFSNGRYVAVMTVTGARGLRNDSTAKDWLAPTSAALLRAGHFGNGDGRVAGGDTPLAEYMGSIENVDCYEINLDDDTLLGDSVGLNGILGEGFVFGDEPVFLAQVMAPELRAGIPTQLGTKREVGWVGTMEAGLVWDDASHSRVIHVTSS